MKIIVAIARGGVIGSGGAMPWHLPEDLAYFKRVTMSHTVIMGRKTFESIGKPLPGRTNVVVTRNPDFAAPGIEVAHSLAEAAAAHPDAFVIGGAQLYAEALPLANELYITEIDAAYEGDTFFPPFCESDWREVASEKLGTFTTAKVYRKR